MDAGEVNAEVWKHFVEQGGQNGWVPAIALFLTYFLVKKEPYQMFEGRAYSCRERDSGL